MRSRLWTYLQGSAKDDRGDKLPAVPWCTMAREDEAALVAGSPGWKQHSLALKQHLTALAPPVELFLCLELTTYQSGPVPTIGREKMVLKRGAPALAGMHLQKSWPHNDVPQAGQHNAMRSTLVKANKLPCRRV